MLRLAVRQRGKTERIFASPAVRVSIGRGPGNVLTLDNPHVSSRHAMIEVQAERILFRDLGSTNGSMIQRKNKQIDVKAGGKAVQAYIGDHIILGDSEEPVLLVLLDDDLEATRHPVDNPPDTAVSQVPVDPEASGHILLRRAAAHFSQPDERFFNSPGLGRLLFSQLASLGHEHRAATEQTLIAGFVQSLFLLCPELTHVSVQLVATKNNEAEQKIHFVKDNKDAKLRWSPGRGALCLRSVVAREAWLVEGPFIETADGQSLRVPMALSVPLLRPQQSLGCLFADNRASGQDLQKHSLETAAALVEALAVMLDMRRLLNAGKEQSAS